MTRTFSRRQFIRSASLGLSAAAGLPTLLTPWARAQTPEALIGAGPPDPDALKAVAHLALEAARAAGASSADLRILTGLRMKWEGPPHATASINEGERAHGIGMPILLNGARIGIRTWVDGNIGFAGDSLSHDPDQIAALARLAVNRAKAWPAAGLERREPIPAPVVEDGYWETPVERDPFAVALGEQEALLLEGMRAIRDIKTESWLSFGMDMQWKRVDELFASTDGSLIRQRIFSANHDGSLWARPTAGEFAFVSAYPANVAGNRGYEALADFPAVMARMAQEAEAVRAHPWRVVDSGSHDVVLSARAAAQLLAHSIGPPLELDRALMRANAAKERATSYAPPPDQALGVFQVGNELLNVAADRSRPGLSATVGWDADGVKPQDFDLVRGGLLMDYIGDRIHAAELAETHERLGMTPGSRGCAADGGGLLPMIKQPNLALLPGAEDLSEDDLIRDVKRGYFIDDLMPSADHSGLNVQARGMHVRQIVEGRKADVVMHATLQFNTPRFWNSLQALGGAKSVGLHHEQHDEKTIEKLSHNSVTAPPVRLSRVHVVNTGRRGRRSE